MRTGKRASCATSARWLNVAGVRRASCGFEVQSLRSSRAAKRRRRGLCVGGVLLVVESSPSVVTRVERRM